MYERCLEKSFENEKEFTANEKLEIIDAGFNKIKVKELKSKIKN